jgi:hypothetical protein
VSGFAKGAVELSMSTLPPKADMCGATRDVRFGPIADIAVFPNDVRALVLKKFVSDGEAVP